VQNCNGEQESTHKVLQGYMYREKIVALEPLHHEHVNRTEQKSATIS